MLEPIHNAPEEAQALGRVHRIGQTQSVRCVIFYAAGTAEERLLASRQDAGTLTSAIADNQLVGDVEEKSNEGRGEINVRRRSHRRAPARPTRLQTSGYTITSAELSKLFGTSEERQELVRATASSSIPSTNSNHSESSINSGPPILASAYQSILSNPFVSNTISLIGSVMSRSTSNGPTAPIVISDNEYDSDSSMEEPTGLLCAPGGLSGRGRVHWGFPGLGSTFQRLWGRGCSSRGLPSRGRSNRGLPSRGHAHWGFPGLGSTLQGSSGRGCSSRGLPSRGRSNRGLPSRPSRGRSNRGFLGHR